MISGLFRPWPVLRALAVTVSLFSSVSFATCWHAGQFFFVGPSCERTDEVDENAPIRFVFESQDCCAAGGPPVSCRSTGSFPPQTVATRIDLPGSVPVAAKPAAKNCNGAATFEFAGLPRGVWLLDNLPVRVGLKITPTFRAVTAIQRFVQLTGATAGDEALLVWRDASPDENGFTLVHAALINRQKKVAVKVLGGLKREGRTLLETTPNLVLAVPGGWWVAVDDTLFFVNSALVVTARKKLPEEAMGLVGAGTSRFVAMLNEKGDAVLRELSATGEPKKKELALPLADQIFAARTSTTSSLLALVSAEGTALVALTEKGLVAGDKMASPAKGLVWNGARARLVGVGECDAQGKLFGADAGTEGVSLELNAQNLWARNSTGLAVIGAARAPGQLGDPVPTESWLITGPTASLVVTHVYEGLEAVWLDARSFVPAP